MFRTYNREWLPKDLVGGLSIAAIAMPVGIAYAGIAGLPPQTGLYACILPMIVYAFFGSSKQLVLGPDSATCMLIVSAVSPLAAAGSEEYFATSLTLCLLVGLLCLLFGMLRLDIIANFLSRPILNGYLNGLAISIIAGQLGKVFGYDVVSAGIFKTLYDFFSKISETQIVTLILGAGGFVFLRIFKRFLPKLPSPLILVALGTFVVYLLDLENAGVRVVGSIPAGLPSFGSVPVSIEKVEELFFPALGMVLISYCSLMLTNKSFATKNGYEIDANQDLYALGFANISSALSHGFAISGADSRTAVADSAGAKTQLASIVASVVIILVLLFLTKTFTFLPVAILGAIVISASIGLFNLSYLKRLYSISRSEFILALITSIGVLTIGVLPAVGLAVALALIRLLLRASRPHDAVLGKVDNLQSYQDVLEMPEAKTTPGLIIYRFYASLLFFNVDFFKSRIRELIQQQDTKVENVILDAGPIVVMDITAAEVFNEFAAELRKKEITILVARANPAVVSKINEVSSGQSTEFFDSVRSAVDSLSK